MFEFTWWPVFIVLPLPIFVYLRLRSTNATNQAALRVPFFFQFEQMQIKTSRSESRQWLKTSLVVLAWCFLVTAAARPRWVGEPIELAQTGRNLMMAIDLSGSMAQNDFVYHNDAINRLVAVKIVAQDFIKQRNLDRIGLILFGSKAYLQAPLTRDHRTVSRLLDEAQLGFAGDYTAIGDAIGLAIKQSKDKPEGSQVLILLTDGANTAGILTPNKAAELAAQTQLKIYTIGIGADTQIRQTLLGRVRVNPSQDLDEKTLTNIADLTGGRYFRARNVEELNEIYELIDALEPTEDDASFVQPFRELFHWPLSASLALIMLSLLAQPMYGRRIPIA